MLVFYSIQAFRNALTKLCSKPKEGYGSVVKDICNSFKDKSIEEIRINRDIVLNEDNFTLSNLECPIADRS